MNTLKESQVDHVFYTLNPDRGFPDIEGFDEALVLAEGTRANTYLLAPVAKVVEVEIPGETKPVEPYVGLEWRNEKSSSPRRKVLALFQFDGQEYAVIATPFGPDCYFVEELQGQDHYPTTTTPPRTEKRLVMLNGWSREGFASVSESGGTTDER